MSFDDDPQANEIPMSGTNSSLADDDLGPGHFRDALTHEMAARMFRLQLGRAPTNCEELERFVNEFATNAARIQQDSLEEASHDQRTGFSGLDVFFVLFYTVWLLIGLAMLSFVAARLFEVDFFTIYVAGFGVVSATLLAAIVSKYFGRHPKPTRYRPLGNVSSAWAFAVMAGFLVTDYSLSWYLNRAGVNVILVHFLIMASGIVLAGAVSIISDRAATVVVSCAGAMFVSFLLSLLLLGNFEGPHGDANPVVRSLLVLFCGGLLFAASRVVVSRTS